MRRRTKRLLIFLVVLIVLGLLAFGGWMIWGRNTIDYRVSGFGTGGARVVSTYRPNSLLQLHPNGTFSVEIIRSNEDRVFVGFGTWSRNGTRMTFTYIDAWMYSTQHGFIKDPYEEFIGYSHTFNVSRNGRRIYFEDHWGWVTIFSR